MHLNSIDFAVIVVYLVGITAFGIKMGYRRNASSRINISSPTNRWAGSP